MLQGLPKIACPLICAPLVVPKQKSKVGSERSTNTDRGTDTDTDRDHFGESIVRTGIDIYAPAPDLRESGSQGSSGSHCPRNAPTA
jgi:hypothetical protein